MEVGVMRNKYRILMQGVSCCLLVALLPGCASRAVTEPVASDGLLRQRVNYAGLDLNSAAGARMLLHRLQAAAEQVCERPDHRDLAQQQRFHACYAQALAEGVRQVNRREVTALYQAATTTAMIR
jgi:UrcA family protein